MKKRKRTKCIVNQPLPKCVASQPKYVQEAYLRHKADPKRGKVLRDVVPADALPGEWVKLPPMKWPETLPVDVPVYKTGPNPGHYCVSSENFNGFFFAWDTVCLVLWAYLGTSVGTRNQLQSAWSETLIRLGYTEDA